MKPYSKYKASGIQWIGDIPEHWEMKRLKHITDFINRGTPPEYVEESEIGVINQATFSKGYFDLSKLRFTENRNLEIAKGTLQNNDILLASTGGGVLGKTIIFNIEGKFIADSHVSIIRDSQHRIMPRFYYYFLSINFNLINGVLAEGSTNQTELRREWLRDFRLMSPSLPEQITIANFIDYKTAQIDNAITKKKQLIELLEEECKALVNEAVTKGINPKVKLKQTGIEWLGNVPEHWEIKKLKYIAIVQPSNVDKKSIDNEQEILLCNYLDVYKNEFIDNSFDFMKATASDIQISKFGLKKDDVLVTKDSETPDDIANPALVVENLPGVICGYHLMHIRPLSMLKGRFLFRLFQSYRFGRQFEVEANGVTRFGLGISKFTEAYIPLPNLVEQIEITSFINDQNHRIGSTISKIYREIELLKEYRQSLIFEAVTGKIKIEA